MMRRRIQAAEGRDGATPHLGARTLRTALYSPILLASAFISHAAAQGTKSGDDASAPDAEVIVTARRFEEVGQKVPVAISTVNSEQIHKLAIYSPLDLTKVAGLSGAPVGSLTSVNFTIRGQGTAFGGQQGVIPYFAEVPNYPLSYFDLLSIQVLKGPQGTLFGQSSTGGVILFEPKRPTATFGVDAEVQLGDRNYRQFDGAINVPLSGDRLMARVAVRVRRRDGWGTAVHADGTPPSDLNNVDSTLVRASLLWKPSASFENLTIVSQDLVRSNGNLSPLYYYDTRFMNPAARNLVPASIPSLAAAYRFWTGYPAPAGASYAQLLAKAFDRQIAAGPLTMTTDYLQRNRTLARGLINQTTAELGSDLTLRNILGLRYATTQGATYDQDATDVPLLDFQCRFAPSATSPASPCAKVGGWPERTFTEELQLQGHLLADRLRFQLGAFYLDGGSRVFREDSRPFVVFGNLSGDPASAAFCASVDVPTPCASMSRTFTHSYAVFGQATYEVIPGVRVTGGYRQTWDRTETQTTGKASYRIPFQGQLIAVPIYGEVPAPGAKKVSTVVALPSNGSYNLSVDWQVAPRVLVYAAHRSGYKPGGINAVANPGTPERTYGPERSRDAEIGVKSDWTVAGVRGRLNVDVFQTWYSDIQLGQIIAGTAQTVTANLADARIRGIEIEGDVEPTSWLRIDGSVSLIDGKYTRWSERTSCAAQFWRPQCAGQPGTSPIDIDHARGTLAVAGQQFGFKPDRFANTSKWQWSIRPTVSLHSWLGEDVSAGLNIYGRSPYVDSVAVANSSKLAGVPPISRPTVFGYSTSDPYTARGYGLVDARIDWASIGGSRVSASLAVTNLSNRIYRVSSASAFEIIGDVYSLVGEPRMIFGSVRYAF